MAKKRQSKVKSADASRGASKAASRKAPKKGGQRAGRAPRRGGRRSRSARRALVLEQRNYALMALGVAMVVVGFVMMRIDNQVESFISLYLSPLIILAGYLEIIYAIMWRPRSSEADAGASAE